jgi:hypothetical protein
MAKLIEPLVLDALPRYQPLKGEAPPKGFVCVICGVDQGPYAWRVQLPNRCGPACTGCAQDNGFEVI